MRIGIDWGGTKIEAIALSDAGAVLARKRTRELAHDCGQTAVAQALLHGWKHIRLADSLDEDDAVGIEADGREAGREEIPASKAPQHRTVQPSQDAGHEKPRRCGVTRAGPVLHDLVQKAQGEAVRRQMGVQRRDAKPHRLARPPGTPVQMRDPRL